MYLQAESSVIRPVNWVKKTYLQIEGRTNIADSLRDFLSWRSSIDLFLTGDRGATLRLGGGGGTLVTSILGGRGAQNTFQFILTLYNFINIGGHLPPPPSPPLLCSAVPVWYIRQRVVLRLLYLSASNVLKMFSNIIVSSWVCSCHSPFVQTNPALAQIRFY